MRGWRISPAHFVERFGLIIIIALGKSIVAIGVGTAGLRLDAGVIAAALLGITVAACLWWSYFDWVIFVSQAALAQATGAPRAALARDAYSYLHLPMVAGNVLFAFGLEATLDDVNDPLRIVPALGLCGGIALYLLAHVALRLRIGGGLGRDDRSPRPCCSGCSPFRGWCRPSPPSASLRPSAHPSSATRPSGTERGGPGSAAVGARSPWKRRPAGREGVGRAVAGSAKTAGVRTYRFDVPHCGLEWMVDFDGSFWRPLDPNLPKPEAAWAFLINADRGTIELVATNTAVLPHTFSHRSSPLGAASVTSPEPSVTAAFAMSLQAT